MANSSRREIVRESDFDEQLDALLGDMAEADEFTAAAEWLLSQSPQIGVPASADQSVWYLPMPPVRGRRVSLFYTFDEKTVVFYAILAFDD